MGSKWLELVEAMEEKGLRVTFQRKLIAEVFSSTNGFVLPRQIHSYIAKDIPGVSYDTVYRNLRVMVEIGLIEQFDFKEGFRYKLRCGPDHHHHHFICLACHKTYPLEFCPIDMGIKTPEAFEVISHKFEIYGYCEECAHGK
ncbi:Fur family transcriptional regulator [Paenibacillus sp. FSL R7-0273]|uniref:Fur family transcriptional regulator n=1 Tax=Paenibacillus sp. FSL R7-0273 TaxID=1536772 RepID=UPI0004F782E1|nr:Fur family transcriptional regulator [Paenibacillus sp. FSL R7-0273]AIQ46532.1 Fur family transcriptional regulator [Paenibacillus sp. FSL R7-0273]OMF97701.1 transcriptional repressor [Paenibacillus sp. FSL R7-0273]